MTCEKHCLHWEVCKLTPPEYATAKYYTFCNHAERCECFKDKSKLIELPCNVGDTVYHILGLNEEKIKKAKVTNLEYNLKYNEWIVFFDYLDGVLGKTVFLTREEAEKKLEE